MNKRMIRRRAQIIPPSIKINMAGSRLNEYLVVGKRCKMGADSF
ncbi:MAG: hypothetical protein ACOY3D_06410 [Candidatus Omnitrophota bacterium]